ncbi:MAG: dihydrofolate reductase [Propionicimonas sp.]|uniref:dihydrofolate reductase n=1 Tax=Propionicimonas sp. TaxID=1955623 RepID=UPI002B1F0B09|nr:dihydrofolate reductase [Propionicimonas sp.]MEA4943636.1 dihydrofolate reductase [Propionicimonas sp.]MEA5054062.1 dihydrofolate reductase [Propionicimonas sp.]MEA5117329.1 dihydrofolate reductase [Propionicimonas sp.]
MRIIGIAIVGANGVIGDGDSQPFQIAEDWERYKRVTMGHPMILGRRTHQAIGRWLPGRTTIVVTHDPDNIELPSGGTARGFAVSSLAEALDLARSLDEEIYVAGGGSIYRAAWPELTELDLTEVEAEATGTVFFPPVEPTEWQEVSREQRDGFAFVRYLRRTVSTATD